MKETPFRQWAGPAGAAAALSAAAFLATLAAAPDARAGLFGHHGDKAGCCDGAGPPIDDIGGTWAWVRSPGEEKRLVSGLYNRYCIRCHGGDGSGVWDIPGVPDFTNTRWQASRGDAQIARIILEGRGAVMPPFRGAISLEEAYGLARYLRTLAPAPEAPKPDLGTGSKPAPKAP